MKRLLMMLLDFLYWERPRNPRCLCCRQRYLEVGKLLVEVKDNVFICDSCIDRIRAVADAEKQRRESLPK